MQILKAGAVYFALVFGAGFVLGTIRVLWLVPRIGMRAAEVMEAPLIFVVTIFSAKWVTRRFSLPPLRTTRLGVGFIALCFMLTVEFTAVLWLRGVTIGEYISTRDPVAVTVYFIMLVVFALMPLFVARR